MNCFNVFDHLVGLALQELTWNWLPICAYILTMNIILSSSNVSLLMDINYAYFSVL